MRAGVIGLDNLSFPGRLRSALAESSPFRDRQDELKIGAPKRAVMSPNR